MWGQGVRVLGMLALMAHASQVTSMPMDQTHSNPTGGTPEVAGQLADSGLDLPVAIVYSFASGAASATASARSVHPRMLVGAAVWSLPFNTHAHACTSTHNTTQHAATDISALLAASTLQCSRHGTNTSTHARAGTRAT